jgi:acyl-CoA thioesterase II
MLLSTTRLLARRAFSSTPTLHPKLAVSKLSPNLYNCSASHLTTVFKPGAFGGQLMAQALNASILSTPGDEFQASAQNSSFLAPVLLGKDVIFKSELLRESGKTFRTERVSAYQLDEGEGIAELASKKILFESTVSFYRTPANVDTQDLTSPSTVHPNASELVLDEAVSLKDLKASIKNGELKRGVIYQTALSLATALSELEMNIEIRLPRSNVIATGVSTYFVGVDASFLTSTQGSDNVYGEVERLVLPYISDCMCQVLACSDTMDSKWQAWPRKNTVWNYSTLFHRNGRKKTGLTLPVLIHDKRWFVITYDISGAEGGIVNGQNKVWEYNGSGVGDLLCTSLFQCMMKA